MKPSVLLSLLSAFAWLGNPVSALADPAPSSAGLIPAEAFASPSAFSSPRLSPDGQYLAINADYDDGNYALLVYRIADMKPSAMLRFPRYEMAVQIEWVSDRRLVIAKGRKVSSLEEPVPSGDIIATDLDGSHQTYVYGYEQTTRNGGISRGFGYIAGLPSTPNGHFFMRQLSLTTRHSMLYDVDATSTANHLVADVPVPDLGFVFDASDTPRYAYGTDDDDNGLLFESNGRGGWTQLTAVQDNWRPLAIARDGQHVIGRYTEGGPSVLVSSDSEGQHRTVLASDPMYSVSSLQWTNAPFVPFAVQFGKGKPATHYLANGPEADLYRALSSSLPDHRIEFINASTDGNRLLLTLYSDRDAGGWFLFDRTTNKLSKLLLSRPALPVVGMGERQVVHFKARDGLMLDAVITLPAGVNAGSQALPMVLLPHGGPHAQGDGWGFDADAQFLASRGYLVLQVNYRGGEGRGYDFEKAGYRQWGQAIQNDLIDGVRWAIAENLADPKRVCTYGASFGAYSAMMVAAREPGMFRCAVGLAGIYDLQMMYDKGDIKDSRYGRNYLKRVLGDDPAVLAANSPVDLASHIQVPVFLAHGEQDERAPFAQAKEMRSALEKAGNAPQWMQVPKEGHGFYKSDNAVAFYRALETFLANNLGPGATASSH